MADATKQANFRLSTRHVEIINTLAASQHVTKAAVVEHALELLERDVEGGRRLHANAGGPTRQANFRLSVHHVQIIDRLAARGGVTKAAVVEQALELAQQEVAEGGSISAGGHRSTAGMPPIEGSAALKVDDQREAPVLHLVDQRRDSHAEETSESAAKVEEKPKAEDKPQVQAKEEVETKPQASSNSQVKGEQKEKRPQQRRESGERTAAKEAPASHQASRKAQAEDDDAEEGLREDARDQREGRGKRRTYRARREEVRGDGADQVPPMAAPYFYGGYPFVPAQPAMVPTPAPAPAQPAAMAPAASAPLPASAAAASQQDAQTAVLEERLTNQIEALKQALEAKDARIDAMLKEMDDRRQDDKDARLETLIAQIAEANKRQAETPAQPVPQQPVAAPAPSPAPAQAPASDPRIDEILRRLDSSQKPASDPRIDEIMRQLEAQKSDDRSARLESMIRDLANKSDQPVAAPQQQAAPTQPAGTMRADDIMQIINALKPQQQAAPAQAAPAVDMGRIDEARSTGREEGRREAQAEVDRKVEDARRQAQDEADRKLEDLRREFERKIEDARREGYDQGWHEATADNEKLLAEARTSGAFYERAKIANMRGLVFGEKRRYLKVHVTM